MTDKKEDVGIIQVKGVPVELRKEFKAICAREDTDMTAKLITYMKDVVAANQT